MIYLAHADPLRKDMLTQADFLLRSHKEVGIKEPLIIVKTNERKKFKQYGCVDDYAMYNRYIGIIEYIKNNRLENETICLLDCDMFFHKQYKPILVGDNEIVTQKWIGAERWDRYWSLFKDPAFDVFKQSKSIDLSNPVTMYTPYYMKGDVYSNLFKIAMRSEQIIRKKTTWWMTELLCVGFASACLNLKIKYENLAATCWFAENPKDNPTGINVDDYPLIHYCCPISGKGGTTIKKYKMEDTKFMLSAIDNFVKTDKAYRQVDIKTLEFFKKMYGYKG
jgi:hypothetical protein